MVAAIVFGGALLCTAVVATAFDFPSHAARPELAATQSASASWWPVAHQLAPSAGPVDFTPHGTQPGLNYLLESSDSCGGCHGPSDQVPSSSAFRPHPTWGGSMMANAMRDPLFLAALDVANHDVPGVGDYCLRCHTSQGWYGGRVVKVGNGQPNNDVTKGAAACLLEGSYDAPDANSGYSGLSCHFCHRQMAQGPAGEPLPGNGAVWLDDQPCTGASEPCRRGPYNSPAPHAWKFSPFHTDSAMCGQCHDVTTPDIAGGPLKTLKLADGSDTGVPFPIERTFSEWQRSLFADAIFRDGLGDLPLGQPTIVRAQHCQDCHMPVSEEPQATACTLGGYPNRTGNLPTHEFAGGNTWLPAIIEGEFSDTSTIPDSWQGIGRQQSFDQTIGWARRMLLSAAEVVTTVSTYVAPTAGSAGSLALKVKVTNLSGHKLPSGYGEGRRMWLNVQVHDAGGSLVAESGAYDPAGGLLTVDPQARVYEVLQGIFNRNGSDTCDVVDGVGKPMFHFVLNDCVARDSRIPPLGFKPASAGDPNGYEVRPVPQGAYPETTAGSGTLVNYDMVTYAFNVPAGTVGPLSATARLYYQTSSKDYIEFLRDEAASNNFPGENLLCSGGPNRPFLVGPKERTRGQYMYELWNNPTAAERGVEDGVVGVLAATGYGKSPPELIQLSTVSTSP